MLFVTLTALLVILLLLEFYARWGMGMGDPPLYVFDEEIGYLPKPNSKAYRYGVLVEHNLFGIRGPNFSIEKNNPDEFRVLLLGDSILHGGSFTHYEDLAATLLANRLSRHLSRPVQIINASVGGWGPGHMLAYVRRFGTFDADLAVIMTNSRDYGAVVGPVDLPTEKPLLALQEIATRYRGHVLHRLFPSTKPKDPWNPQVDAERASLSLKDFEHLLLSCRTRLPHTLVVQHWRQEELDLGSENGNLELARIASTLGVPVFSNEQAFRAALEGGSPVYRDVIHPSAEGQKVLADVLESSIMITLRT